MKSVLFFLRRREKHNHTSKHPSENADKQLFTLEHETQNKDNQGRKGRLGEVGPFGPPPHPKPSKAAPLHTKKQTETKQQENINQTKQKKKRKA